MNLTDQIRHFDRLALRGYWLDFSAGEQKRLERFFRSWGIQPGEYVLEPGCGTGRLTPLLARFAGPDGLVAACDFSREMVRIAHSRNLPRNAVICACGVHDLPFPDQSFDRIVCLNAFPHFVPLPDAVGEMARVLRPGGRLHIAHLQSARAVNRIHRNGPPAIRHHLLPSLQELRNLLDTAGIMLVQGHNSENEGYSATGVKSTG